MATPLIPTAQLIHSQQQDRLAQLAAVVSIFGITVGLTVKTTCKEGRTSHSFSKVCPSVATTSATSICRSTNSLSGCLWQFPTTSPPSFSS